MPSEAARTEARIVRLDVEAAERLRPGIERIFFVASGRTFAPGPERDAFMERWLGRYLAHFPEMTFVALDAAGDMLGYLVGACADPAVDPRFADIVYFREFASLTTRYPAHLHINLDARARNQGLGARLVEAFAARAKHSGAPGLHVVTGATARNRTFYARLGFALLATANWNATAIVLLGRPL